jgi:glucuronoxylan 4-O-methyltransferase
MKLPNTIEALGWDVILVDAPAGYTDSKPGRMKSIFLAKRLAASPGDVFVHDCEREVERVYCDRFLGREHLTSEVNLLRHYQI